MAEKENQPQNQRAFNRLQESLTSKKFWFAIFSVFCLFFFAYVAGASVPGMIPLYAEFVAGTVALGVAYITGNIANKWVYRRFEKNDDKPKKKNDDAD